MKGVNNMYFSQLQNKVYESVFIQGLSPQQVSADLNVSLTLVKRALVLIHRKLKRDKQSSQHKKGGE